MNTRLPQDVWVYRMVVAALGLAVLVSLIGAIMLATEGRPVPEVLVALGSAALMHENWHVAAELKLRRS